MNALHDCTISIRVAPPGADPKWIQSGEISPHCPLPPQITPFFM